MIVNKFIIDSSYLPLFISAFLRKSKIVNPCEVPIFLFGILKSISISNFSVLRITIWCVIPGRGSSPLSSLQSQLLPGTLRQRA